MLLELKAWRRLILGLALALAASMAFADTEFPIIGGAGNDGFEDRCPGGEYLLGFNAQMGASMNMVQIVCTAVQTTAIPGQDTRIGQLYDGPLRGGRDGGGPVVAFCDNGQVLTGMLPDMTASGGLIKDVRLWCGDGFGNHVWHAALMSPNDNPYVDQYHGKAPPTVMWCPTGEAGIGVRGREGLDVNAISLICGSFTATAPTVHVASNTGEPIKTTGRAAGSPPPLDTRPASLFTGDWTVTSAAMGTFDLNMLQITNPIIGAVGKDGAAADELDGHAQRHDANHATLTFTQTGLGRGGSVDITISADGDSFVGLGSLSTGQAITWQGARKPPPSAADLAAMAAAQAAAQKAAAQTGAISSGVVH